MSFPSARKPGRGLTSLRTPLTPCLKTKRPAMAPFSPTPGSSTPSAGPTKPCFGLFRSLQLGVTPDAVLTDVEQAMEAMGEITGATVREDITARIFERFCVGK